MNNSFKEIIQSYLEERAKEDTLFAKTFKKANKSIDECCRYILRQVRKLDGSIAVVKDEIVFNWAVHYYDEDDIKVSDENPVKAQVSVSHAQRASELKAEKLQHECEKNAKRKTKKEREEYLDKLQLSLFPAL